MTNWTAQTRQNRLSVVSYKYEDTKIQGFMGTHQPADLEWRLTGM